MAPPIAVLNVVGLTPSMLGKNTPNLTRLADDGFSRPLQGVFPAVTTTAQSAMLTGKNADAHGIVGNGWYFKELAEVGFWKQNNALVEAEKVWDRLRIANPDFKVSNLFWWYNMYAKVDHSITPRPHYLADGSKIFDLYSTPEGLHQKIEEKIGQFPFFNFWGPKAGINSSRWIANAAIEEFKLNRPDLQFVYLPHLDYNLQRLGPYNPAINQDIKAIDAICGDLIEFYQNEGVEILVVSEYGICEVDTPVHINRILRENGYIKVRKTVDKTHNFETLDCGASVAFAVSDHQCAHIYLNDLTKQSEVKTLLQNTQGIAEVLDKEEQVKYYLNHARSGDLVAIADSRVWFTYYFWMDDKFAPDFARTVDIHRKPGYDPVELFIDPKIKAPGIKVASKLVRKKLGQRVLMDLISLDASLVKGSHGRLEDNPMEGPVLIGPKEFEFERYHMTDVFKLILSIAGKK